jgi:hypothetical protein
MIWLRDHHICWRSVSERSGRLQVCSLLRVPLHIPRVPTLAIALTFWMCLCSAACTFTVKQSPLSRYLHHQITRGYAAYLVLQHRSLCVSRPITDSKIVSDIFISECNYSLNMTFVSSLYLHCTEIKDTSTLLIITCSEDRFMALENLVAELSIETLWTLEYLRTTACSKHKLIEPEKLPNKNELSINCSDTALGSRVWALEDSTGQCLSNLLDKIIRWLLWETLPYCVVGNWSRCTIMLKMCLYFIVSFSCFIIRM